MFKFLIPALLAAFVANATDADMKKDHEDKKHEQHHDEKDNHDKKKEQH